MAITLTVIDESDLDELMAEESRAEREDAQDAPYAQTGYCPTEGSWWEGNDQATHDRECVLCYVADEETSA